MSPKSCLTESLRGQGSSNRRTFDQMLKYAVRRRYDIRMYG